MYTLSPRPQVVAGLLAASDVIANVNVQSMPMYTCLVKSFLTQQLVVLVLPLVALGITACITTVRLAVLCCEASHCAALCGLRCTVLLCGATFAQLYSAARGRFVSAATIAMSVLYMPLVKTTFQLLSCRYSQGGLCVLERSRAPYPGGSCTAALRLACGQHGIASVL